MPSYLPYLLIGVGGFLGANARFVVARIVASQWPVPFPLGTFLINVSGSFLLGLLWPAVTTWVGPTSDALRLSIGVGFLGAFTTFSTFELETHGLLDSGAWLSATGYVAGSVALGLLAVRAGIALGKIWL